MQVAATTQDVKCKSTRDACIGVQHVVMQYQLQQCIPAIASTGKFMVLLLMLPARADKLKLQATRAQSVVLRAEALLVVPLLKFAAWLCIWMACQVTTEQMDATAAQVCCWSRHEGNSRVGELVAQQARAKHTETMWCLC